MKRHLFVTQYRGASGTIYGHQIEARTEAMAHVHASTRGLGEQVIGLALHRHPGCARVLLDASADALERIHAVVFLARLAIASRVAVETDFLDDDTGILHQLVHLEQARRGPAAAPGKRRAWQRELTERHLSLVRRVLAIERLIPGYAS